mgnify:CR=1 FL=1
MAYINAVFVATQRRAYERLDSGTWKTRTPCTPDCETGSALARRASSTNERTFQSQEKQTSQS